MVAHVDGKPEAPGTFTSEYEYEIEYECDFSHLLLMLLTITFYTNLVPIVLTGQQHGGVRALRTKRD